MLGFEKVRDLATAAPLVRRRRYGVICAAAGQLHSLEFRPWPKLVSRLEVATWGRWRHQSGQGDRCRLFYNAPLTAPGFLSLAYIQSTRETRWKTVRRALEVLDWIAQVRSAVANVCELSNERLSLRLMSRLGWQAHCEHLPGRHFIKRFYGDYPRYDWLPDAGAARALFTECASIGGSDDVSSGQIALVRRPPAC